MLDNEADIVRVASLDRVKADAEALERATEEVLGKIRARMEPNQSERGGRRNYR